MADLVVTFAGLMLFVPSTPGYKVWALPDHGHTTLMTIETTRVDWERYKADPKGEGTLLPSYFLRAPGGKDAPGGTDMAVWTLESNAAVSFGPTEGGRPVTLAGEPVMTLFREDGTGAKPIASPKVSAIIELPAGAAKGYAAPKSTTYELNKKVAAFAERVESRLTSTLPYWVQIGDKRVPLRTPDAGELLVSISTFPTRASGPPSAPIAGQPLGHFHAYGKYVSNGPILLPTAKVAGGAVDAWPSECRVAAISQ